MESKGSDGMPNFNEGEDQQPAQKREKMKLSGHEQGVMATSNDALLTKVVAAQHGYF